MRRVTAGMGLMALGASPAQAQQCSYGGFGGFGGGYCDSNYWPDGSFYHCYQVSVFGTGGGCGRVCPGNLPYPGPGPEGRC